jgi:hypothetical protein
VLVEELQDEKKIELATRIYSEVCNNIKTTDEISFRLLGLVPLLSAAGIFGISVSLGKGFVSSPFVAIVSFFAAIVTGALLMWEWRNLNNCRSYIRYAKFLEEQVFFDALGRLGDKLKDEKQIKTAEGQFRSRTDTTVIRKTVAELIIYSATILAWLAIGTITLIR